MVKTMQELENGMRNTLADKKIAIGVFFDKRSFWQNFLQLNWAVEGQPHINSRVVGCRDQKQESHSHYKDSMQEDFSQTWTKVFADDIILLIKEKI